MNIPTAFGDFFRNKAMVPRHHNHQGSPSGPVWTPLATPPAGFGLDCQSVSEGDDSPSGAGPSARAPTNGHSDPVTVGAMESDSDMEISDDDRPLPSSVGSCLQTHPPSHQEAHDFLSSLLMEPEGDGAWSGDRTVVAGEAGVCLGTRPVDAAGVALVATIPDVDLLHDASVSRHGHPLGLAAPVEDPAAAQSPGGAVGTSYRQRRQSRSHQRQLAKRNAATAASFLR